MNIFKKKYVKVPIEVWELLNKARGRKPAVIGEIRRRSDGHLYRKVAANKWVRETERQRRSAKLESIRPMRSAVGEVTERQREIFENLYKNEAISETFEQRGYENAEDFYKDISNYITDSNKPAKEAVLEFMHSLKGEVDINASKLKGVLNDIQSEKESGFLEIDSNSTFTKPNEFEVNIDDVKDKPDDEDLSILERIKRYVSERENESLKRENEIPDTSEDSMKGYANTLLSINKNKILQSISTLQDSVTSSNLLKNKELEREAAEKLSEQLERNRIKREERKAQRRAENPQKYDTFSEKVKALDYNLPDIPQNVKSDVQKQLAGWDVKTPMNSDTMNRLIDAGRAELTGGRLIRLGQDKSIDSSRIKGGDWQFVTKGSRPRKEAVAQGAVATTANILNSYAISESGQSLIAEMRYVSEGKGRSNIQATTNVSIPFEASKEFLYHIFNYDPNTGKKPVIELRRLLVALENSPEYKKAMSKYEV